MARRSPCARSPPRWAAPKRPPSSSTIARWKTFASAWRAPMSNGLSLIDQLEMAVDALLAVGQDEVPALGGLTPLEAKASGKPRHGKAAISSELDPLLRIAASLRDLPR